MRLLIPLFSPATGTWGGLTCGLAVAEAAASLGHEVAFCASGSLERTLRQRGHRVYALPPATMLGLPAPLSRLVEQRSQRLSPPVRAGRSIGSVWLVLIISGYGYAGHLRRLTDVQAEAAHVFGAEALFTDLDPGAFLTAAATGLPMASTYAAISTHGRGGLAWRWMARAIAPVLRRYGRPACTPGELFCDLGAQDHPLDPRARRHRLGSPRRVLRRPAPGRDRACIWRNLAVRGGVALRVRPSRHRLGFAGPPGASAAPGLSGTSRLTCLVGAQGLERPRRIGGVEFRPYVPAEALLPSCDWSTAHGGQNTIIQSLRHGVSLVVFSGAIFERRFNAAKVQEAGAEVTGEAGELAEDWLRAALAKQAVYAPRAAALGTRIHSYGGAQVAVTAIAAWAGRG